MCGKEVIFSNINSNYLSSNPVQFVFVINILFGIRSLGRIFLRSLNKSLRNWPYKELYKQLYKDLHNLVKVFSKRWHIEERCVYIWSHLQHEHTWAIPTKTSVPTVYRPGFRGTWADLPASRRVRWTLSMAKPSAVLGASPGAVLARRSLSQSSSR